MVSDMAVAEIKAADKKALSVYVVVGEERLGMYDAQSYSLVYASKYLKEVLRLTEKLGANQDQEVFKN